MSDLAMDTALEGVKRSELVSSAGVTYAEFRRTLMPRYHVVWLHVFLGYLALAATVAAGISAEIYAPRAASIALAIPFGALVGYFLHYLHLFMHEGAHYNLAKDRKANDFLANLFVGSMVGMHIRPYRPTHFDHHRHLGTTRDTEISYFDPLNLRFFAECLLGLRVLKVMVNRNKTHKVEGIKANKHEARLAYRAVFVSAAIHGTIMLALLWFGWYATAAAWAIGAFAFYPFWGSLRTLLEHRNEHADKHVDYTKVDQGAVSRMFGTGPIASSFGHAGFNRHLLHHWDPQVSYTRLKDLERFLMDTNIAATIIDEHRTSYAETFVKLYNR